MRRLAEESAGLGLTVAAIDISGSQVSDARPFALAKGRLWDTRPRVTTQGGSRLTVGALPAVAP
jgi:hypothetical protein